MKNQLRYSLINSIIIPLLIGLSGCERSDEPVVARIDDINIGRQEFIRKYSTFLSTTQVPDNLHFRYLLVESLVDEKIFLKHARDSGVMNTAGYIDEVSAIEKQLLLNAFYEQELKIKLEPTEAEVRQLYQWSKQNLHVRHLFARDRETIDQIHQQLEAGADWDSLAKRYFNDPVLSSNGGDLGFFKLGEFDPSFEAAAFVLADQVISLPVQTDYGFSIIQVIEREYDPFLTEEDFQINKKWLATLGRNYRKKAVVKKFTDELAGQLDISFNQDALEQIYTELEAVFNGNAEFGLIDNKAVVAETGNGQTWDTGQLIMQLQSLSERQQLMIQSPAELEVVIQGLIIRNNLFGTARSMRLDQTRQFQNDFTDLTDQLALKITLKPVYDIGNDEDMENRSEIQRQAYFSLRDSLRGLVDVFIDSAQIKLIGVINPV